MKMAFFVGIFLASPYILWEIWGFISPGLYKNEKVWAFPFIGMGSTFFALGALFGHYYLFPLTFRFLGEFGGSDMRFLPKIDEYYSFYSWFLLGLGLVFQIPVVIFVLARIGLVTPRFRSRMKWVIVERSSSRPSYPDAGHGHPDRAALPMIGLYSSAWPWPTLLGCSRRRQRCLSPGKREEAGPARDARGEVGAEVETIADPPRASRAWTFCSRPGRLRRGVTGQDGLAGGGAVPMHDRAEPARPEGSIGLLQPIRCRGNRLLKRKASRVEGQEGRNIGPMPGPRPDHPRPGSTCPRAASGPIDSRRLCLEATRRAERGQPRDSTGGRSAACRSYHPGRGNPGAARPPTAGARRSVTRP
jgi:hypothetical protein